MAQEAKAAGYRAVLFKSNDFSCHDRAYLLRQAVPGIELFGSIVLNRATGATLNTYAVEKALATTGNLCRTVWMPTLDAEYAVRTFKQNTPFIRVSDGNGKLLPETLHIMELCAQTDVAFATGHSSPTESLLMAQAAHDMGFKKCIITHPNALIWKMSPAQLERAASLGAWIEFCYLGRFWGEDSAMPTYPRQSLQEATEILRVAPERTFITTDLGQVGMPRPVAGMRQAHNELLKAGFSAASLKSMLSDTPAYLIGLEKKPVPRRPRKTAQRRPFCKRQAFPPYTCYPNSFLIPQRWRRCFWLSHIATSFGVEVSNESSFDGRHGLHRLAYGRMSD